MLFLTRSDKFRLPGDIKYNGLNGAARRARDDRGDTLNYSLTSAVYALLISFMASVILCPVCIPYLTRLKIGQTVRGDGPKTHLKKSGTPTMGGIVILLSFFASGLFFVRQNYDGLAVMLVTLGYAVIGFADDYIKVVKKRSLGLRAYQKMLGQIVITGLFAWYIYRSGAVDTRVLVPFADGLYADLGLWFYPFLFVVMVGTVNGVNFTDGLDGLAAGVTLLIVTFFLFMSLILGSGLLPVLGAAIGSLLGFLLFNSHPARVIMGDTGSLALGGLVASAAILLRMPLIIVVVGFVYLAEVLSVIIQVGYFKLTKGRRVFKMAPIHNHFELSGFSETRVVAMFYVVTAIACLIGFLAAGSVA